ncbi:MAG: chromate efflux transporter [Mangrovibacterium sp.]
MKELIELSKLFLKLGIIGFGGPAAHIAMMRDEVVIKRKWMDDQHFLDLIGATNLIPGPNSTEMTMHIGHERAGWKGLVVAGLSFIVPAVLITGFFAVIYKTYGQLPEVQPWIYGIKPAIIAIILAAVYPLARRSLKTARLGMIGFSALALSLLGIHEIYVLFGAGIVAVVLSAIQNKRSGSVLGLLPFPLMQLPTVGLAGLSSLGLFLTFLKIGAILYGSGYVLFAFLDTELVANGLLSRQQLIDAIAVGQFTPGPVFSSVTFVGYQMDDFNGALLATLGIFLPSFLFVALLNPLVRKLRNSKLAAVFLDAVNIASVAIILAICYHMGRETITNWQTVVIALASLAAVFGWKKVNSAIIVLGGSGLGYLLSLL